MGVKLETCVECKNQYPGNMFTFFLDTASEELVLSLCMYCALRKVRAILGNEYQFNTPENMAKYAALIEYDKQRGVYAGTN